MPYGNARFTTRLLIALHSPKSNTQLGRGTSLLGVGQVSAEGLSCAILMRANKKELLLFLHKGVDQSAPPKSSKGRHDNTADGNTSFMNIERILRSLRYEP